MADHPRAVGRASRGDTVNQQRATLKRIARIAMLERGLAPDLSPAAEAELNDIRGPAAEEAKDLRSLLWCSIDNDDSRDLDQLTFAELLENSRVRVLVAVADVDAIVKKGSAIDLHAQQNTTSVYTAAEIFPMLPEKLSTDLTSLGPHAERLAVIVEMIVEENGDLAGAEISRARVDNHAKLAYNSLAAWLDGTGPIPEAVAAVPGLDECLRLQDRVAQKLRSARHQLGALELETIEARPLFDGDSISDLRVEEKNRARELIEDFMIAANGATARFLEERRLPSLRRVVREPERWDRIVDVASELGESLPADPDCKALAEFLARRRAADPLRFPDLSLTIVKLMGPGEYVVEVPGERPIGHFGLAVKDYTHSTAPNRRYPDLITQRLLKSALARTPAAYEESELGTLAGHCTRMEDAAAKVERRVRKSAAALLMSSRIGEKFDAIVTGASEKGTWVRLLAPPVEGKLEKGFKGLDVGDRVRVRLVHTDVERGFIDFARA